MLARLRIVLVSPSGPANIGAACRAMANMGLAELVITAPRCNPQDEAARAYAAHGLPVLERARVVADIPAALAGCVRTYATSSKLGLYRRQAAIPPDEAAREALGLLSPAREFTEIRAPSASEGAKVNDESKTDLEPGVCRAADDPSLSLRAPSSGSPAYVAAAPSAHVASATNARVAFAFGREDYGLKTEELLHFDRIITIPADEAYPVMNLAAAVAIVCYELRRAWLAATGQPALPLALQPALVAAEKKEVLFERLFDALDRVGFLFGQNPDHLKYALRHLFGRVDLSVNEADILIGLARQIRWYVEHHPQRIDP